MINDIARKSINVDAPNNVPVAQIKEYDDFILKLALMKYNTPFDCTGQTATLGVKAPSGLFEQTTDITINKDQIDIKLKTGIVSKSGICEMELKLTDSTGSMTTASFFIAVNRKILNDEAIEASDEFDSLTEAKQMEPIRQENELKRQENEKGRVEAEKLRVQSETNRADAENIREQQELARQTCYKEIEESRMDFDGGIHKNLKLRLMRDFGDIYERFNKANLLPYEAEYISASNSFKGITEDNVVKGMTLQNLYDKGFAVSSNIHMLDGVHTGNGYIKLTGDLTDYKSAILKPNNMLKSNTVYTVVLDIKTNNLSGNKTYAVSDGSQTTNPFVESVKISDGLTGVKMLKFTTKADLTNCKSFRFILSDEADGDIEFRPMILEGDYTNKPIPPYFEGIKSVNEDGENLEEVSCGKNLIDITKIGKFIGDDTFEINLKSDMYEKGICNNYNTSKVTISYEAKLGTATNFRCDLVYDDNSYTSTTAITQGTTFEHRTATSDISRPVAKIRFNWSTMGTVFIKNLQIEISPVKTDYEPYQEQRQTTKMKNLRSLPNGVCDTSDGVRRVGKATPSNTVWKKSGTTDNVGVRIYCEIPNLVRNLSTPIICNKFPHKADWSYSNVGDYVVMDENGMINIRCDSLKGIITNDVTAQKWANDNNLVVYYPLPTPTKEEGNTEELRTYDGITNIFTEGSLIEPTISVKIPSNVQAVVMNLREENKTLNNDVNTLQATTEENNLMNIETNVNQEARLTMLELGVI